MKFRIDPRGAFQDPLHWIWVVCYIGAAMLILGPVQGSLFHAVGWMATADPIAHTVLPEQAAVLAGGREVTEGIMHSSDHTDRGVWSGQVTTALIAMLLSYMLGPASLVWGLRARARYRQRIPVRGGVPAIAAALALGGVTFAAVVPAPLYALVGQRTHAMLVRDDRQSEALDDLSVELYVMARNAQVKYHRSGAPRGGGHSWLGSGRAGSGSLRMSDLLEPGRGLLCADSLHVMIGPQVFGLQVERADSLTLHGMVSCDTPGRSSASGTGTPKILSMVVGVTPQNVNMTVEE